MDKDILKIDNLTKSYGKVIANKTSRIIIDIVIDMDYFKEVPNSISYYKNRQIEASKQWF